MKRLAILAVMVVISSASLAQAPRKIQTTTRLVTIFTNLENQLMDAAAQNNSAGAMRLLSEDFSQWTPQPPGSAISREEWLKDAESELNTFQIRQMAVKDLGQHAAANFVLLTPAKAWFIVDVWQKDGENWRLLERYQAPVDRTQYSEVPRPTGKH